LTRQELDTAILKVILTDINKHLLLEGFQGFFICNIAATNHKIFIYGISNSQM
jgi:hypothetical protein